MFHINTVNRIKQLPNGFIATVSSDKTVKLWNSDACLIQTYAGHVDQVYALEYINSNTLVSGSLDCTIKTWSISTGKTLQIINVSSSVHSLKLLSNGLYLASGLGNGSINIYDIRNGSLIIYLLGHTDRVNDLVLMNDDQLLASSSDDKTIRIWNLTTHILNHILMGHSDAVYGLKYVSFGILASGSRDSTVKLWNVTNGTLIRALSGHSSGIYNSVDLLSDGKTLVSGSLDKTVKQWDWISGQLLNISNTGLIITSFTVIDSTLINTSNYFMKSL